MKRVIVRYEAKPDRADENVASVQKVFAELVRSAPEGLRYMTFQADDGVSFTHIAPLGGERQATGIKAVRGKSVWWGENHEEFFCST
jgi:hypothetical protein